MQVYRGVGISYVSHTYVHHNGDPTLSCPSHHIIHATGGSFCLVTTLAFILDNPAVWENLGANHPILEYLRGE